MARARTPSAKTLASATAYFRLARKATINGNTGSAHVYTERALRLQAQGYRQRDNERAREAARGPGMSLRP